MRKFRVLLCDDEPMILEGFKRLFSWETHGCIVAGEAQNGEQAIRLANILNPDLVIMDINLPVISGLDAVAQMQVHHRYTKFIIVTGYDRFEYCKQALKMQVVDYILKPVDFDEFGQVVEKALTILKEEQEYTELKEEPGEEKSISRILKFLDEHLGEELSLGRLSREMNLNSAYISQLFKKETGEGFHAYLSKRRVEMARGYLVKTDLSVAEIAERVGYGDYRVFNRTFKAVLGETPSQYRRKYGG